MHAGSSFSFARSQGTYVVHDATGYLPVVNLTAYERGFDGTFELCAMGLGIRHEPGSSGVCDEKWNVVSYRYVD